MDFITLIGIIGASGILLGFVLNELHVWSEDDLVYDAVNLFASGILIVYSVLISSIPFLVLNIVWFVVSLRDVVVGIFRR